METLFGLVIIIYQRFMKKISATERTVKDLLFLRSLPKQEIVPGVIKRLQAEGSGEQIKQIKIPCSIYLSFYKYDYEGRLHSQLLNICIRDINKRSSPEIPLGVYLAVETMKVEQKAWFNIALPELHGVPGLPHGGCHFYITVEDLKYKNSDTFQSKKIVSDKCRQQAKKLFEAKDYQKALKHYRKQINITTGIDKKKYKKQQLEELNKINEKAKRNLLRCFSKLTNFDENLSELAEKCSKQLMKKDHDDLVILLRCHVLKQRKYLSDALKLAEQLQKKDEQLAKQILQQLRQLIKSKK